MNFEFVSQYLCNLNSPQKNITCPSRKLRTEFTSPIAKFTSSGLSDTNFFACWLLQSASVTITIYYWTGALYATKACYNKENLLVDFVLLLPWDWEEFMVKYFFHKLWSEATVSCEMITLFVSCVTNNTKTCSQAWQIRNLDTSESTCLASWGWLQSTHFRNLVSAFNKITNY